jgi:BirA family transcriptional regulator, biotin operon repressor / biotin---[acetyl-CoA-carboxylase] ligase
VNRDDDVTLGGDLAPARVAATLTTRWLARQYTFLPACDSTNDEVVRRAMAGADEGLLVATNAQSKGRGRRGRQWHSPAGENLYFSLLLRPRLAPHRVAPMTLLVGAALAQALRALGFAPRLKWPNDVLLEGSEGLRKVAGILTEMATEGARVRHVVIGIGINVNTRCFPAELAAQAVSLAMVRGESLDRLRVLAKLAEALEPSYEELVAAGPATALAQWRRFAILGQPCWFLSGDRRVDGIADAVDEGGALLVRTADGTSVPVHAGEINWRKAD